MPVGPPAPRRRRNDCNGYAVYRRDSRLSRVVYVCDRYGKPEVKPKNPDIHESETGYTN
jgi:hypothetical protein